MNTLSSMGPNGHDNYYWQPQYNASGALLRPPDFFEKHFSIFRDFSVFFQPNLDIFLLFFRRGRTIAILFQFVDTINR